MLALFAGQGELPEVVAAKLQEPPLVCALHGFAPDKIDVDVWFRLETLGSFLADMAARGVSEICFAGAISRPPFDPSALDAATLPLVPVLQKALLSGDDGALRAVVGLFESRGITVRAAHDIVPGLLPAKGVLTRANPDASDKADATRGAQIVQAMASVDIGQACIVARGQALAVEGVFGTDWMLASLSARPAGTTGGILFKAPKSGQDRRIDMPTIGPSTISGAVAAGLRGLVLEAGGVMVLDRIAVIKACDAAGLFLWVRA